MTLSQFCRELDLHAATVQKFIADQRETSKANIRMTEELTPGEQRELAKAFPNHTKVIKITCVNDEDFTVQYLGDWDGRLVRAADRAYAGSYKKEKKTLQKPDRPEGFTSYPTREEIRDDKIAKAEKHKELLKAKGRLDDEGNIISDYEFAQRADAVSLPLPRSTQAPEVQKIKSLAPTIDALDNTVVDLVTEIPDTALPAQSQEPTDPEPSVKMVGQETNLTTQGNE